MLHYCVMFLCMCPGTTDNIFYGCVLLWLIICDCNIHNNSSNISQCKMFTCSVTHVRGVHLWSKRCHRWLKRCHLSHLHTCDTGHWTCENFILWYIGGVILPQTHLMQQTTTNATIIRWRNTPFWRPSSLRRSKLVNFYCHKIYSWELCALSTGFYSKEKSVLWQKKGIIPK